MVGFDGDGSIMLRRRVRRHQLPALSANLPASMIGMEAAAGRIIWIGLFEAKATRRA